MSGALLNVSILIAQLMLTTAMALYLFRMLRGPRARGIMDRRHRSRGRPSRIWPTRLRMISLVPP